MPSYETDDDLAREAAVKDIVECAWGVWLYKMPKPYRLDFAVYHGDKVVGFMEVRTRSNASMAYPTFMMSAAKHEAAKEWAKLGVPTSMVVQFTDGLFVFDPSSPPDQFAIGGRSKPRDEYDRGLMAHYDTRKLQRFSCDARFTHTNLQYPAYR